MWRRVIGCVGAIAALTIGVPFARPAAASTTSTVAVVGGSISRQPANAAGRLDRQGHFTHDYPNTFDGGTIVRWADPADVRWAALDEWLASHPDTTTMWWEVVFHESNFLQLREAGLQAAAEAAWTNLKPRIEGREVYVSPMFGYLPGSRCKTSDAAVAAAEAVVATLLAEHRALHAGPVFDPAPPDQVDLTGCHTNDLGDDAQGAVLNAFFDAALG
jgi:hypothetical protein